MPIFRPPPLGVTGVFCAYRMAILWKNHVLPPGPAGETFQVVGKRLWLRFVMTFDESVTGLKSTFYEFFFACVTFSRKTFIFSKLFFEIDQSDF